MGGAMQFSIFYFSGDGSRLDSDKYQMMLDTVKYADTLGFTAVWTPERHFVDFGGLYPNPAVLSAALAVITKRIQLRAGSVVIPLHHPIRIAEEWSMVDNLSGGRVGISAASGWHPNDFLLAPVTYADRKKIMLENIAIIRKLWTGESVEFRDSENKVTEVRVLPRPIQKVLPIWLTTAGNPETWVAAGEIGANVLASLMGQTTVESLARNIKLYRDARSRADHDPLSGEVAVMLHTYISNDVSLIHRDVVPPLSKYLHTFMGQMSSVPASHTGLKQRAVVNQVGSENIAAFAAERYIRGNSLIGTPEKCIAFIARLAAIGVDEIACLFDFGVSPDSIRGSMDYLSALHET